MQYKGEHKMLTSSYLTSVKNLDSIMNSVLNARAPERFTTKFLEDLGFKSSNDRLYVGIFKALGLIDDNGSPQQRYFDFLDQTQSKRIIALGIQEAYEDLFNLRKDAQNLTNDEVKNKLKTLTQGQKGDRVIDQMALTFRALCSYADWSATPLKNEREYSDTYVTAITEEQKNETQSIIPSIKLPSNALSLCYNIQIHLPETTNLAVYDAIFQSIKKHLL